jgi:hypothetical protein
VASDKAILQRVDRHGERDQQPSGDALHAEADLGQVAVAQLAEHALVGGCPSRISTKLKRRDRPALSRRRR